MSGSQFCNTHAPRPHDEFICHGTGERRQNIINEIKQLLDKADDRPCIIPKIRPDDKMRPIMNYPGFVDKRHPVFQPPEPPPLITYVPVQEVRQTSEPGRVADDPPNMCYKVRQFRQKKPEKDRDLLFRLHDIEMDLGSDTSLRQNRREPELQGEGSPVQCCCYKVRCEPKRRGSGKDRDLLFRLHQNDLSLGSDTTLRKGGGKQIQHHGGAMAMKGGGKDIELRGGQMISTCECVRRNGLQDQCPRRECGGRPECVAVNPGPCCEPAMAMHAKDVKAVEVPPEQSELCKTNKGIAVCCCCHQCN